MENKPNFFCFFSKRKSIASLFVLFLLVGLCLRPESAFGQCDSPPNQFAVSDGGTFCLSESFQILLVGSELGVTYQLKFNGEPVSGSIEAGNGYPISFLLFASDFPLGGIFTVEAIRTDDGCKVDMAGQAMVTVEIPISPTVAVAPAPACPGTKVNISATSPVGSINWYDAATGGNFLFNSPSGENVSVSPNEETTYFAQIKPETETAVQAFYYTGGSQTFTVPAGVTSLNFDATGASGGNAVGSNAGLGGYGGRVYGTLNVTPGQVLQINVGGKGGQVTGGFNGGGNGGGNPNSFATGAGGGGGGATDVRIGGFTASERVIVAGGGGGGGGGGCENKSFGGKGGEGTGQAGANGMDTPTQGGFAGGGKGGTLGVGGAAGIGCSSFLGGPGHANGTGGNAQTCCCFSFPSNPNGGGGGGGYINGGGGGAGSAGTTGCSGNDKGAGGGGGGGSSFAGPGNVDHATSPDGSITFSWQQDAITCISTKRVPVTVKVLPLITYYKDNDEDGFGDPNISEKSCTPLNGFVEKSGDCDDSNDKINPDATEICNEIDDNCDGKIDEGCPTCSDPIAFEVTGGGIVCGNSSVAIGLSDSEMGVSYQLKNGADNIGSPVTGTGGAISFAPQNVAGTYSVVAKTIDGGCTTVMLGVAEVSEDKVLPTISSCPTNTVIKCQPNATSAAFFISAPILADNCNGPLTWSATFSGNPLGNPNNQTNLAKGVNSPLLQFKKGTTTVSLIATDAKGNQSLPCEFTVTVNTTGTPSIEATPISQVSCFGGNNGSFSVKVSNWSGSTMSFAVTGTQYTGASFSSTTTENPTDGFFTISNLKAGKYKVKATWLFGSAQTSVTTSTFIFIKHPPQAMSPTLVMTPASCDGGASVTINQSFKAPTGLYQDASLIGAVNFTFTSGPGSLPPAVVDDSSPFSANFTDLQPGNYACTVLVNNCGTTSTVNFTTGTLAPVTAISKGTLDNPCFGNALGKIRIQASNGDGGPYKYQLGSGLVVSGNNAAGTNTHEFTGLAAGTYSIAVFDSKGCSTTLTETVKEPTLLVAGLPSSTNVSCFNGQNGTATFSATGGTPPYSFKLGTATLAGNESATFTQLSVGQKTCTITDANGCKTTATVTITQPTAIVPSAMITNVKCFGGNDGAIKLTVAGGTPDYSYKWSDVMDDSKDRSGLNAGTYVVTIADANGCSAVQTVSVNEPAKLVVETKTSPVGCGDEPAGAIDLTISGGIMPYSINWNDLATSEDRAGLEQGIYSATVTDGKGCIFETGSIELDEPSLPVLSNFSLENPKCADGSGSATIEVCGEGGPYMVSVCQSVHDEVSGEYVETTVAGPVEVSGECAPPTEEIWVNTFADPSNLMSNTAFTQSRITRMGAFPDFTGLYGLMTEFQSTFDLMHFFALASNNGFLGGQGDVTWTMNMPAGYSEILLRGEWQDFPNSVNFGATVTINGQPVDFQTFFEPQPVSFKALVPVDPGGGDIIVFHVPATDYSELQFDVAAKVYNVDGGPSGPGPITFTDLAPGSYTLKATGSNGCTVTGEFTIGEAPSDQTEVTIDSKDINCHGDDPNGSALIQVCGESGPYSVQLYTVVANPDNLDANIETPFGNPSEVITNCGSDSYLSKTGLAAGNYLVRVTNANGCSTVYPFTIREPEALELAVASIKHPCSADSEDGAITWTLTGGTPFEHDGFQTYPAKFTKGDLVIKEGPVEPACQSGCPIEAILSDVSLSAGIYTYLVTDANGCTAETVTTLEGSEPMTASESVVTQPACSVDNLGGIDLNVSGGKPPYSYDWVDIEVYDYDIWEYLPDPEDRQDLVPGSYTVFVTDANGCTSEFNFTLSAPPNYSLETNPTTCHDDRNGSATLEVCGQNGPYSVILCSEDGLPMGSAIELSGDCLNGSGDEVTNFGEQTTAGLFSLSGSASFSGAFPPSFYPNIQILASTGDVEEGSVIFQVPAGHTSVTIFNALLVLYDQDFGDHVGPTIYVDQEYNGYFMSVDQNTQRFETTVQLLDPTVQHIIELRYPSNKTIFFEVKAQESGSSNSKLTREGLNAGSYQFKITDQSGCVTTVPFTIDQPEPVSATASYLPIACHGGTTTVTLTGEGGNGDGGYTFKKGDQDEPQNPADLPAGDGFSSNNVFSGLGAGAHIFYVKDANGCEGQVTVNIADPEELMATATAVPTGECNSNTWLVTVEAAGGTGELTGIGEFSTDNPGTFTYPVTDEFGCLDEAEITLTPAPALEVFEEINNISCNGLSDGEINLNVSGGTPFLGEDDDKPYYAYSWSGEGTVADAAGQSGLAAGTYTVTVTDARGCMVVFDDPGIIITESDAIFVVIDQTPILCHGGCSNVSISSITGGVAPYEFDEIGCLPTNKLDPDGQPVPYEFTVTDASGCKVTTEIFIEEPSLLEAEAKATVVCFGELSTATVTATGGTEPYLFTNLETGESNETGVFSDLGAGEHSFSVVDGNGCKALVSVTVADPEEFYLDITIQDGECDSDGSISIEVIGGVPDYSFVWENADGPLEDENGSSVNPPSGEYWVTVTDGNGCIQSAGPLAILQATPISATATTTPTDCAGGENGAILVSAKGGHQDFVYSIDGGDTYQNPAEFMNLPKGEYEVIVKDGAGCTFLLETSVSEPTPVSATFEATPTGCGNSSIGSFTITAMGGTPDEDDGYLYSNDNGDTYQTSPTFTELAAGIYLVKIKDKNGCTFGMKVEIKEAIPPAVSAKAGEIACFGGTTSITATGDGGKLPYKFALDGNAPQLTGDFSNVAAGTHNIVITDENGCMGTASVSISQPTELAAEVTNIVLVTCAGGSDGSITVSAEGGTPGYSFQMNGGTSQSDGTFNNLAPGDYSILVKDMKGCSKTVMATVKEGLSPVKIVTSFFNVNCFGEATGSITAMASGGFGSYEYRIGTGSFGTANTFTNLAAGDYTIEAKDEKGCTASIMTTIGQPAAALSLSTEGTPVTCNGSSDGSVTVNASGGTAGYLYKLGNGDYQASNIFQNLATGTYVVVVKDTKGCVKGASVNVAEPAALKLSAAPTNASCNTSDGKISAMATGGNGGFEYKINNGAYQSSGSFSGLAPGDYTVAAKDSKGCIAETSVTIISAAGGPLKIVLDQVSLVSCVNSNDGAIQTSVTGCGPFTFVWSRTGTNGTVGSTEDLINIPPGTYSLFVIENATGMTASLSNIVVGTVPTTIQKLAVVHNTTCEIKLSWDAVPNATGYEVRYQPCSGGSVWTTFNAGTATEFTITNLVKLSCYNICVRYKGENCDGQWTCLSSTLTTTPEYNPPINLMSVIKTNTSALVKWAQSNCAGPKQANVELRFRKQTNPVTASWSIVSLADTSKQHLIKNLTPGACYEYRLRNKYIVSGVTKWSSLSPSQFFCLPLSTSGDNSSMMLKIADDLFEAEQNGSLDQGLEERSIAGQSTDLKVIDFTLSPNPASDFVNVHFNSVDSDKLLTINLLDISGRLVSSQSGIEPTEALDYPLAVETLLPGIYFIEISNGASRQIGKFVKH